jgi:hypothetical protein
VVAATFETAAAAVTLMRHGCERAHDLLPPHLVAADAMTLPLSVRLLPMTFFDHDNH